MKSKKKSKKKKNIMLESDEYGGDAVDIGIGNASAETEANKRKKELSLTMSERLQLKSEQSKFMGETKRLKVTGQGASKEVTFIPQSDKKKKEAKEKAKQEAMKKDDRMGRSRRGIKDLGFKTPFKHLK